MCIIRAVSGVTPLGDPGTHLVGLGLSMGQWLCVPMLLAGAALYAWGARQPRGGAARAVAQASRNRGSMVPNTSLCRKVMA